MTQNTRRILLTGSRVWGEPELLQTAMLAAQEDSPPAEMLLTHGKCPPRDPAENWAIPWEAALTYSIENQRILRGADWHGDMIARQLGWQEPDSNPAEWRTYGRYRGGAVRNKDMARKGALRGIACLSAGLRNRGTLGCAIEAALAGIPLWCLCDACGVFDPEDQAPCETHSIPEVTAMWATRVGGLLFA